MNDLPKHQGQRQQLIETLKAKGINDVTVLEALQQVPRHFFMDQALAGLAYTDKAYPIAAEQTISQPFTVAFQTALLALNKGDKVLEIGTGSGYQTAVLLQFGVEVYTIERQNELFKKTQLLFRKLGLRPKKMVFGDGAKGLPEAAPFDAILVTAGASEVPHALLEQLAQGGRLVIPIGQDEQQMTRFIRTTATSFDKKSFGAFRFVPLLADKN